MPMPLYKKILLRGHKGVQILSHIGGHTLNGEVCPDEEIFRAFDLLPRAVALDCIEAADFLRRHDMRATSVGVIEAAPPPFKLYWLEWAYSDGFHTGALVEVESVNDDVLQIMCVGAFDTEENGVLWGDVAAGYYVNPKTGAVYGERVEPGPDGSPRLGLRAAQLSITPGIRDPQEAFARVGFVANWVIKLNWFLQVRNIVFEEVRVKPKEAKALRAKSKSKAKLDLRTVRVSRTIRRNARPCPPGHETRDLPLHVVMGHFKCYDTRPLFGRIKGTFFWPAHTRGSVERGTINKEYVAGSLPGTREQTK